MKYLSLIFMLLSLHLFADVDSVCLAPRKLSAAGELDGLADRFFDLVKSGSVSPNQTINDEVKVNSFKHPEGEYFFVLMPESSEFVKLAKEADCHLKKSAEFYYGLLAKEKYEKLFTREMLFSGFSSDSAAQISGTLFMGEDEGLKVQIQHLITEDDIQKEIARFKTNFQKLKNDFDRDFIDHLRMNFPVKDLDALITPLWDLEGKIERRISQFHLNAEIIFSDQFKKAMHKLESMTATFGPEIIETMQEVYNDFKGKMQYALARENLSESAISSDVSGYFDGKANFEINKLKNILDHFFTELKDEAKELKKEHARLKGLEDNYKFVQLLIPMVDFLKEKKSFLSTEQLFKILCKDLENIDKDGYISGFEEYFLKMNDDGETREDYLYYLKEQGNLEQYLNTGAVLPEKAHDSLWLIIRNLNDELKNKDIAKMFNLISFMELLFPVEFSFDKKDGMIELVKKEIIENHGAKPLNYILYDVYAGGVFESLTRLFRNKIFNVNFTEISLDKFFTEYNEDNLPSYITEKISDEILEAFKVRVDLKHELDIQQENKDKDHDNYSEEKYNSTKERLLEQENKLKVSLNAIMLDLTTDKDLIQKTDAENIFPAIAKDNILIKKMIKAEIINESGLFIKDKITPLDVILIRHMNLQVMKKITNEGVQLSSNKDCSAFLISLPFKDMGDSYSEFIKKIAAKKHISEDYAVLYSLIENSKLAYENYQAANLNREADIIPLNDFLSRMVKENYGVYFNENENFENAINYLAQIIEKAQWDLFKGLNKTDIYYFARWSNRNLSINVAASPKEVINDYSHLYESLLPLIKDSARNIVSAEFEIYEGFSRLIQLAKEDKYIKGGVSVTAADVDKERKRLIRTLKELYAKGETSILELYDPEEKLLRDEEFSNIIINRVSLERKYTLKSALDLYASIKPERQEIIDLIKENLREAAAETDDAVEYPNSSVFYAEKLEVMSFLKLCEKFTVDDKLKLKAVIVRSGSLGEHWVSIARSKGVTVFFLNDQLSGLPLDGLNLKSIRNYISSGENILIQGNKIELNPSVGERDVVQQNAITAARRSIYYDKNTDKDLPKGLEIGVTINPDPEQEMITRCDIKDAFSSSSAAITAGSVTAARNIDLYRTEFHYENPKHIPSFDEQVKIYTKVADYSVDSVTGEVGYVKLRTFDRDVDKPLVGLEKRFNENNEFVSEASNTNPESLGIRFALNEGLPYFEEQLKAMLYAQLLSKNHNIKIMFPMIENVEQVNTIEEIIKELKLEIKRELHEVQQNNPEKWKSDFKSLSMNDIARYFAALKTGVMIETNGAVENYSELVESDIVDFFSIGSNDLTKFTVSKLFQRRLLEEKASLTGVRPAFTADLFDSLDDSTMIKISRTESKYNRHFSRLELITLDAIVEMFNKVLHEEKDVDISICGEMASIPEFYAFLAAVIPENKRDLFWQKYKPGIGRSMINRIKSIIRWLDDNPLLDKEIKAVQNTFYEFAFNRELIKDMAATGDYTLYESLTEKINQQLEDVLEKVYAGIDGIIGSTTVQKDQTASSM